MSCDLLMLIMGKAPWWGTFEGFILHVKASVGGYFFLCWVLIEYQIGYMQFCSSGRIFSKT
jgi:hypothetical protein